MPSYTLDELLEMMAPQARKDIELINKCIHGLETYAAQQAMNDPNSPKIAEMRELIDLLVGYWGLSETEFNDSPKSLEDYMLSFDNVMVDIKAGATVSTSQYEQANTIYGLFRYGTEMETAQGRDAVFDILYVKKLMNEIAAFWDFESHVLDNLIERLDDEVGRLVGPQSEYDREFKNECITGLGLYAAEKVRDNFFASEPETMRELVEKLVSYWGLDGGENAKSPDDYLDEFDNRVWSAKHRKDVPWISSEYKAGAIYGAYRYGEELVATQGSEAMSEILDMRDLMMNIAMHWNFKPYDVVVDYAERLRAEVRGMLDKITLPGQPAVDVNVGYHIRQAILFNNDRGFVLAHSPTAVSPYVTWTFAVRDGEWSYDVGDYRGTEERAKLSYISRASKYLETYRVTEKPIPAERLAVSANSLPEQPQEPASASAEKPAPLEVFIQHDDQRAIGLDVGEWLKLPATAEALGELFTRIGVPGPMDEFYSVTKISGPNEAVINVLTLNDSLDQLNMLAICLSDMEDWELKKLSAALKLDVVVAGDGAEELINMLYADNFDMFDLINATNEEELGRYWETEDHISYPEGVSHAEPGRELVAEEKGVFTEWGYIYFRYKELTPQYDGIVPQQYRIVDKALLDAAHHNKQDKTASRDSDDKTSVMAQIKASRSAPQQPHKPKTERDKKAHETEL